MTNLWHSTMANSQVVYLSNNDRQGRLQRGKWTQLASSLAQGGKNSTLKGEGNSPRYMGHIDD